MVQHHAQDQDQQVVEDLVNDLLSYPPPFISAHPPRRRRQRPSRAASCVPLDSPLVRAPTREALWSGGHAHAATPPQHSGTRKPPILERSSNGTKRLKDGSGALGTLNPFEWSLQRPDPDPTPKHSLRTHLRRTLLSTRTSDLDSPLARPHQAAAATIKHASSSTRRSQSEHVFPTAPPLPHRPQPPAELRRTPSFRNVSAGGREGMPALHSVGEYPQNVRLKAVAHTLIATLPTRALGGTVANADLAMLKWEHQERLALAVRQREVRHDTVQRQAASKLLSIESP